MIPLLIFLPFMIHAGQLPQEIKICKLSNEKDFNCILSRANKALSVFANGNDELGLPSLDPLKLLDITVDAQPGSFSMYQKYTNILLKNMSTGKFEHFEVNTKDCSLRFTLVFDVRAVANYELKGSILSQPIHLKGLVVSDYPDFKVNSNATCERYKKNGKEYIKVLNVESKLIISKTKKVDFGTEETQDPELNKQAEKLHGFLKDDPNAFTKLAVPVAQTIWNNKILELANLVFTKIPLDELF